MGHRGESKQETGATGQILDASHCKTITDLARHLIEVAKLAAVDSSIDLPVYSESVLDTRLGKALAAARIEYLRRNFIPSNLLLPGELLWQGKGIWRADCPACARDSKRGTMQVDDTRCCFFCENCQAQGGVFELVALTAPNLRKFMSIEDRSYLRALLMFRFGLLVETAKLLSSGRDSDDRNSGKPAPIRPTGPWRPRGSAPAALEVALAAHQDEPCSLQAVPD